MGCCTKGAPACFLLLALCVPLLVGADFVRTSGHQLVLDGQPFYFIGANAYWLIDAVQQDHQTVDDFFKLCNDYGLKVVRLWAFNYKMPEYWNIYDQGEFAGLDYIIYSAGQHYIKLTLALGNSWEAYRSPEDFMRIAGIDPANKTILDFYDQSSNVFWLYRDHIRSIVTRNNTFNGKQYKDDDAIMMWDLFNEPRCPGCTDDRTQGIQQGWLSSMSDYLKGLVPNQLVAAGTEGFFMNENVQMNPGAGSMCEGENWLNISRMESFDVSVAHIYDRQMESVPPTWVPCDWRCYFNFFPQYLNQHITYANNIGKPLVIEEFNVILPVYTEAQRTAFFKLVYDQLLNAQSNGSPLMGVMFWNAAIGTISDDGYNIYLDVTIQSQPISSPSSPLQPQGNFSSQAQPSTSPQPQPSTSQPGRAPITANNETLDDFRRASERAQCAEWAAYWWLPYWNKPTVDVDSYIQSTQGMMVQAVIKNTATQLYGW